MSEISTQTAQNLFPTATTMGDTSSASPLSWSLSAGLDMSQNEKDAIMRQIHPIFLTTHSEEKAPVSVSNFDKFLWFLRLCLEGLLKLVDIVVDAAIQIARLFVWIIAIIGVLIVVTLMTNTTDKFIDILNSSIFPIVGLETKIQKVGPTTPIISIPNQNQTTDASNSNLGSSSINENSYTTEVIPSDEGTISSSAEAAREELIRARRARLSSEAAQ